MTTELKSKFEKFVDLQIRRIFTHLDRDPDSPTFGCFDRPFWHYKSGDYYSSILQQSVQVLEGVRSGVVSFDAPTELMADLVVGSLNNLARQINSHGAVDEYYPNEHSYVAGAFALQAAARVLLGWQEEGNQALLDRVNWSQIQKFVSHMQNRKEHRAKSASNDRVTTTPACQMVAALSGLYVASKLKPIKVDQAILDDNLAYVLRNQDPEGWFNEYGGPDFGYLSVTIDALVEIHRVTLRDDVFDALKKAIAFTATTIGCDGKIPFELGSRNTEYFYPYGLAYVAQWDATASWVTHTIFEKLLETDHFMWSIDDRYMCHCTFSSIVKALPYLDKLAVPERPRREGLTWLSNAGLWIKSQPGADIMVSTLKGGVLRIARSSGKTTVDYGLRLQSSSGKWTTNWWSRDLQVKADQEHIEIKGYCHPLAYDVPTPLFHFALRFLAFFLRDNLKPFLKKAMILRHKSMNKSPEFSRRLDLRGQEVLVQDIVQAPGRMTVWSGPRQNIRYVPSANNFLSDDFILLADRKKSYQGDGKVTRTVAYQAH